jgi:hypothetical protein
MATVRYGFHPRCGESVVVTGRQRYREEMAYIIRQPDGTLAAVPAWMMEELASSMTVNDAPRLPLSSLRDLRFALDTCLSLLCNDSCHGGDEHEAQEAQSPPTGSVRRGGATDADATREAHAAGAADRRASVGDGVDHPDQGEW